MELKTRHVNGITILELEGRFDAHTAQPVDDFLHEATLREPAYSPSICPALLLLIRRRLAHWFRV